MDNSYQKLTGISMQSTIFNIFIELGETEEENERVKLQKMLGEQIRRLSQLEPYLEIERLKAEQQKFSTLFKQAKDSRVYKQKKLTQNRQKLENMKQLSAQKRRRVEVLKQVINQNLYLEQQIHSERQSKELLGAIKYFQEQQVPNHRFLKEYQQKKEQEVKNVTRQIKKCRQNIHILNSQVANDKSYIKDLSQIEDKLKNDLAKCEHSKLKSLRFGYQRNNSSGIESEQDEDQQNSDDLSFSDGSEQMDGRGSDDFSKKMLRYGPWIVVELMMGVWMYLS